jgi:hypothetical protein
MQIFVFELSEIRKREAGDKHDHHAIMTFNGSLVHGWLGK